MQCKTEIVSFNNQIEKNQQFGSRLYINLEASTSRVDHIIKGLTQNDHQVN